LHYLFVPDRPAKLAPQFAGAATCQSWRFAESAF
jgi:hypothetical protein